MTATYFADTSFWIAFLDAGDQYHAPAFLWRRHTAASRATLLTTEAVLWETLNHFAVPATRFFATRLYRTCHNAPDITVVGHDPALTTAALRLYESRPDKSWGITDCLSFEVMRRHNLTLALTADHHFTQAGFDALLLRNPTP